MEQRLTLGQLWSALALGPSPSQLPADAILAGLAEPEKAGEGSVLFVGNEAFLKKLTWQPKSFYFIDEKISLSAPWEQASNCFRIKHAMLAMARASQLFASESAPPKGVHPQAAIAGSASLGSNIAIGPFVVIGEKAIVGDNVYLHPGVRVGANVRIGAGSVLFPNVVIYDNCQLGDRVRIHAGSVIGADGFGYAQSFSATGVEHVKIAHTGRVVIGDDVEIGASTTIDRGTIGDTVIGKGSKIDNQVQIGHNCQIGEGVIVCGSTGVAGSTQIGKNSVIAGFVGIGHGTKIGAGATIAGFSMVFGEIAGGETWGGVPARPLREALKLQAYVARLPELFKSLKAEKKGKSHDS